MLDQHAALDVVRRIQERISQYDSGRQDPTEVIEAGSGVELGPVEVQTPQLTAVTKANFWHHPDAHPVALDLALLRRYGPDFLDWEPETLRYVLRQDVGPAGLSDINLAKVQAAKTLHLVDTFWEDWEVYLWCTMALNGVFPNFEVMQAPTAAQCLVSVDAANHLRDDVPWGDEVRRFVDVCFRHDGLYVAVSPADFLVVDRDPELADFAAVEAAWPKVKSTRRAPSAETPEGEQLRRMLGAYEYLEESRAHLHYQLSFVEVV